MKINPMPRSSVKVKRTRKVSPTIQDGAELPLCSSKNAPRQVSLVNFVSWKSTGLIVQLRFPPKEMVTLTEVSQAVDRSSSDEREMNA